MRNLLVILLSVLFASCTKDPDSIPYEKLNVPGNLVYRDMALTTGQTMVVCGGEGSSGFILYSSDSGKSWNYSEGTFNHPVNALYFINADTGFCADGDVIIRRTTDGGITWSPFYDSSWPLTVNRNLRSIWFATPEKGFVCGGKNLGNGVMYVTGNTGDDWDWSEFEHEYRALCFTDSSTGILCGHGSLLYTLNGGATFENSSLSNFYFTGADCDSEDQFIVCDLNGRMFSSRSPGGSWNQIREGSDWSVGAGQLNTVAVSPSGKIAAAGPSGFLTWSHDNGNSWNDRKSFNGSDIFKVKWLDDVSLVCAGRNGIYLTRLK